MPDRGEPLRVGSVCTGVGGFELGLHRADPRFEVQWMCEVIERRREVLNRHWPGIPIHDDLTELDPDALAPIDLLVGGTPCQDLSVAGKRSGLEGERSGLFWHFIRLRNSLVPRWTVWENVPGALSSNNGLDFALVLGAFVGGELHVPAGGWARSGVAAGPWGGCVWRTLNSQHFGVPQRRHRVFVVGCFGGMVPPEVLLERQGSSRDSASSKETGEGASRGAGGEPKRPGSVGTPGGVTQSLTTRFGSTGPDLPDAEGGWLVADEPAVEVPDVAPAITKRYYKGVESDADDAMVIEPGAAPDVAAPLTKGSATGEGVSEPGRRMEDDVNLVAFDGTQKDAQPLNDLSPSLRAGKGAAAPVAFESRFARNGRGAPSEVVPPLKAQSGSSGKGDGAPLAFVQNQREELREVEQAMALSSAPGTHQETRLAHGPQVRRLTPTECERLQGFPDGWTLPTGRSLVDAASHYQRAEFSPSWERWVPYTKLHAANHEDDYESWKEADVARTMVDGRLNANLAVEGVIHSDAIGRSGDAKTPSPDAEGKVRLRDPGLGVSDDDQSPNLTTGKPHAVSFRTAQRGANGIGVQDEIAPTLDETGGGAVGLTSGVPTSARIYDEADVAPALQSQDSENRGGTAGPMVAHALTSEGHDASEDGTGRGTPLAVVEGLAGAACVVDPKPDSARYAAMGDAVTVPVISFIGSRIAALEDGKDPDA